MHSFGFSPYAQKRVKLLVTLYTLYVTQKSVIFWHESPIWAKTRKHMLWGKMEIDEKKLEIMLRRRFEEGVAFGEKRFMQRLRDDRRLNGNSFYRIRNEPNKFVGLTTAQIAFILGENESPENLRRLSKELKRAGWFKCQRRRSGRVVWVWNTLNVELPI